MATEAQIREAERARLEAIVAEDGTEGEQTQLLLSGVLRSGVTLGQYLGEEPLGHLAPDPALLVRLARRVERREKAGLLAVACAGEPSTYGCACLEFALDAAGGESRRAILRRARGFHWAPPARSRGKTPTLPEAVAAPQEATERVEAEIPTRVRDRDVTASEPVFRPVRRRPKWYDPRPGSFRDMQF